MNDQEEYLLMRYADGEVSESERAEAEALLAARPELREEMEAVAAVRVTPPVAVMPGKKQLLKKAAVPVWGHVAAAAVMAAVAVWLLLPAAEPPTSVTATNTTPVPIITEKSLPCPAPSVTVARPKTIRSCETAVICDTQPLIAIADGHPLSEEEPVITPTPMPNYPVAAYVKTDRLAVVKEEPTVMVETVIEMQLTSTPVQTLVRELLALKTN